MSVELSRGSLPSPILVGCGLDLSPRSRNVLFLIILEITACPPNTIRMNFSLLQS